MKRNKFNLSYTNLFSCDAGELIPCGITEVLPGDTLQMSSSALIRCSALLAPVYHPYTVRIHHFFVPFRIIWNSWEDFITGGPSGTSVPTFPTVSNVVSNVGTLHDYLGVPPAGGGFTYSALPVRAYQLINNEWYRDQDLNGPQAISLGDGPDTTTSTVLQNCSWEKDYFTSARPWELKGPSITIPLGTRANVLGIGPTDGVATAGMNIRMSNGQLSAGQFGWVTNTAQTGILANTAGTSGASVYPNVYADLTTATSVTVNTLRQSLALQRFEEARARYGSRYTEYLRYLGVRSSDARLQRPEYLGGGKQVIQFSEVLQTGTDGTNPVGTLRGHGISAIRSNRFRRFFEEHGYVMSMFSIRPKTIYMQGCARHLNRRVKEDFWQKELEHIGQQKIKVKEIYATGANSANWDNTFGYQDRYDEYRREESRVAGDFRTTLNFWHGARDFGASEPVLNGVFVYCLPTERMFAVPASDNFYVYMNHHIRARRLVAKRGTSLTF